MVANSANQGESYRIKKKQKLPETEMETETEKLNQKNTESQAIWAS